jgi:hypothetical protein
MKTTDRKTIIAAACHQAWYAYTVIGLKEDGKPWADAPVWQKQSVLNAVDFWDAQMEVFAAKRDEAAKLDPEHTAETATESEWARRHLPSLSHANWMEHKTAEGWVFGEVKDAEKKTHPCMVPYNDLDETQQVKDLVVVEAYLAMRAVLLQTTP